MQALILAAGRGERLRPLTDFIPKPLLPIDGKPVILHILETLKSIGFREIIVTLGYLSEKIEDFLEENKPSSLKIDYAYQERLLGSADAIVAARKKLKNDFLAMAADTVFREKDIRKIIQVFKEGSFQVVVGLKKVRREEIKERSTTKIDQNFFLQKIIEKPQEGEELSLISVAPIYLFKSKTIWKYLEKLKPSSKGIYELAMALQNIIDEGGKIRGVLIKSSKDITKPVDLLKHNFPYLKSYLKELKT